ncbi:unnamed protein product, partial [Linum tenue]
LGLLLRLILAGQLLQRLPIRLRHQKRETKPHQINESHHYQRPLHPNPSGIPFIHLRRIRRLRRVQEPERPHDRPGLPRRRRYPVARRPQPRGEYLRGEDKRRRIGPEVGKEESQPVEDQEPHVVPFQRPVVVRNRQREHEHRHANEPDQLNLLPPHPVDQRHRDPVPGDRTAERDDRLCPGHLENLVDPVHRRGRWDPLDGGEDVLLE